MQYEVIEKEEQTFIKRTNDNGTESWIPSDPANSDYQAYLKHLEDEAAPQ